MDAEELAKELGRLRWRGLAFIDNRRLGPLVMPHLEALARRHTAAGRLSRVELLRRLLQDGLQAFEEAGHKEDAEFTRLLFFGDRQSTVLSREAAGDLLTNARKDSNLNEDKDKFDDRRRDTFRDFANFLLGLIPMVVKEETTPDTNDQAESDLADDDSRPSTPLTTPATSQGQVQRVKEQRSMSLLVKLLAVGVILIAVAVWAILQFRNSGDTRRQSGPSTSALNPLNSSGSTASSAGRPILTFADLGGGSSIINVYPGVKDTPEDRRPNGTYQNGNTVGATCKVSGRSVTSNTAAGERPKASSTWIEIAGSPGVKQYAPLTYAAIEQSQLTALPSCKDAP